MLSVIYLQISISVIYRAYADNIEWVFWVVEDVERRLVDTRIGLVAILDGFKLIHL